ncbi:hypothetical protein HPB51_006592 [Rhipicephalus microplus]|uniref:Uncharacterized protein n=1 Tax=Rhipicephalus microplus TaxID=6941 RepID=A0A9J6E7R1_RHIMP|nr:hypothetical protein HPB51_006592 [Rhipicephalus microplus]
MNATSQTSLPATGVLRHILGRQVLVRSRVSFADEGDGSSTAALFTEQLSLHLRLYIEDPWNCPQFCSNYCAVTECSSEDSGGVELHLQVTDTHTHSGARPATAKSAITPTCERLRPPTTQLRADEPRRRTHTTGPFIYKRNYRHDTAGSDGKASHGRQTARASRMTKAGPLSLGALIDADINNAHSREQKTGREVSRRFRPIANERACPCELSRSPSTRATMDATEAPSRGEH